MKKNRDGHRDGTPPKRDGRDGTGTVTGTVLFAYFTPVEAKTGTVGTVKPLPILYTLDRKERKEIVGRLKEWVTFLSSLPSLWETQNHG